MKEIYAWVPWFRELARAVANGTQEDLRRRAKQVRWSDNPDASIGLIEQGHDVDPFSFLYTLASRCRGRASRERVCNDVTESFDLEERIPVELDDAFTFPQGMPVSANFRTRGTDDLELLWRLFEGAVEGRDSVRASDFDGAYEIPGVGTYNLTQALFLANPEAFLPYDLTTKPLMAAPVKRPDWSTCCNGTDEVRSRFPGCRPWEVDLFAYLFSPGESTVGDQIWQASTEIDGEGDCEGEFFEHNWVRTGKRGVYDGWDGSDSSVKSGEYLYPLERPAIGDVILVGHGRRARGVAIVVRNDYRSSLDAESRLHVVWINKLEAALGTAVIKGFWGVDKIERAFREAAEYRATFEMLDGMRGERRRIEQPHRAAVFHPRNQVLYGPPGTGKTWNTVNLALAIIEGTAEADHDLKRYHELRESGRIATVTFHQNFAYEDFIEGIRPVLGDAGGLRYERRDGLFKTIAKRAKDAPAEQRFVLIIDEINRGNVARIFGELITLIEDSRREGEAEETVVTLPYSNEPFSVPGNLYLIGTMNTADRSIELLDTALRRRFVFRELMPESDLLSQDVGGVDCQRLLRAINQRITLLLDREHQIGHTYLLNIDSLDELGQRFRERIFPLLQEYFFDDWSKIHAVLGGNPFVVSSAPAMSARLADLVDEDQRIWQRLPDGDPQWTSDDAYRAIYAADTDEA